MSNLQNKFQIEKMFFQPTSHVQFHVVEITPEIAEKLLKRTDDNLQRKSNLPQIDYLVRQLVQGKWRLNGDSIRQDKEGNIIDGYHRLKAAVKSGISFKTGFVKGVSIDSMNTIDIGARGRTLADVLDINTGTKSKYRNTISSVAQFVHFFEKGMYSHVANKSGGGNKANKLDADDFMKWIELNPDIEDFVAETMRLRSNGDKLIPSRIFCGLKFILDGKNKSKSDVFFQKLSDGVGVENNSIIKTLRKKLISYKSVRTNLNTRELVFVLIRCWNCFIKDKDLKFIKTPSKMPDIIAL